jgi:hypothetical protein
MERRAILSMGLAAGALAAPGLRHALATPPVPVDVELVLAVDVAQLGDAEEMVLHFKGYEAAFRDPALAEGIARGPLGAIAVTLFTWAGPPDRGVLVPWTRLDSPAACHRLGDAIAAAPRRGQVLASISAAMDFAARQFGRGFEGTRRVMGFSGGGLHKAGRGLAAARRAALEQGIIINGLALQDRVAAGLATAGAIAPEAYYRDEVIGGPGSFLVVAEGFAAFEAAVRRKIIREIALAPPPGERVVYVA